MTKKYQVIYADQPWSFNFQKRNGLSDDWSNKKMIDKHILEISLRKLSEAFDDFVGECMKDGGPTKQDIAKARGYLPPYCKHAYAKKAAK